MPRKVRVCTTARFGRDTEAENQELASEYIAAAGQQGADLVCLPESYANPRGGIPVPERIPGPTFDRLSTLARRSGVWVVAGMYVTTDEGLVENSAVVIDRQGDLAGRYAKVHPPDVECDDRGVTPGAGAFTLDTDFGCIGLAICFDIGYPALWQQMADQGAELVVWSSEYDGGFPLQSYAWQHLYYVVSSSRDDHSQVIDISGRVLTSTEPWSGPFYYGLTSIEIDLEKELFLKPYNDAKLLKVQREFGNRVDVRVLGQEGLFTLESNDRDWPVARIKHQYGLESYRDYYARSERIQWDARARAIANLGRKLTNVR